MANFTSRPERRILFDNNDDETYGNGATRAQIVNSPCRIETREVHPEEPRSISTNVPIRSTSSIGTSVSSSELPRIPVTGVLGYGGGTAVPHRPRAMNTATHTTHRELPLEEVMEVMILLATIVIEQEKDLLVAQEDLLEEEEKVAPSKW